MIDAFLLNSPSATGAPLSRVLHIQFQILHFYF